MVKVIENNTIKIGKEPVVILSLKKWEKIRDYLEETEDRERFLRALEEGKGKKGIGLNKLRKKYKL
jgi:hypothetical protein